MLLESTYVTVDLDAVEQNIAAVRRRAGVPVMAVIKADAYGHGALPIAKVLADKCDFFAVARLAEALALRRGVIETPILLLGDMPVDAFEPVVKHDIRPTLYDMEAAQALSREALRQNKVVPFHIAVDTGMSRIGFQPTAEAADICARMTRLPGIRAEGIFSHYATADCQDLTAAREQGALFDGFLAMLHARGVEIPLVHMSNSAGVMNFENHYAMVRSGIATYGLYPSDEVDPKALPLVPALSWYSHVSHVKTLPAGRAIGYGGSFVTEKETVVATVSVGYGDGYCRSLSNRFYVLIRGRRAPILGRICMDQMMVDVTDIPGLTVGDRVVLVGSDGQERITVAAISQAAGSFPYEFVCGISRRVPRQYVRDGKTVQTVDYLLDA